LTTVETITDVKEAEPEKKKGTASRNSVRNIHAWGAQGRGCERESERERVV